MMAYYDEGKKEGYLLFNDDYNSQSVPTIRLSDTAIHDLAHIACKLYTEAFGEKYKEEGERMILEAIGYIIFGVLVGSTAWLIYIYFKWIVYTRRNKK